MTNERRGRQRKNSRLKLLAVAAVGEGYRRWKKASSGFGVGAKTQLGVGEVANELALPPNFTVVHPVFHVSMLLKYISDLSYVFKWDSVQLDEQLAFVKGPVLILASDIKQLRTREIPVVKD
ncbi:uncharacterized protein LOC107861324 [Capsicum annuum]|uniref:uncharacterized protein LOC107861324 n=1 Tax=Capsicum annuum TaxID=4072 RepID=UPI0007BFC5F3|nr:uncharacterized protein LOC107861324 [Capsicum annuum]